MLFFRLHVAFSEVKPVATKTSIGTHRLLGFFLQYFLLESTSELHLVRFLCHNFVGKSSASHSWLVLASLVLIYSNVVLPFKSLAVIGKHFLTLHGLGVLLLDNLEGICGIAIFLIFTYLGFVFTFGITFLYQLFDLGHKLVWEIVIRRD